MTNNSMIRLVSPNLKSDELVFYWQQNARVASEENKYIINTIQWVIKDIDDFTQDKDLQICMNKTDLKSYSSVKELSEMFNRKLINLKDEWTKNKINPDFLNRRVKRDHLRHILDYCYTRAVGEPDKLNQYVPFSAEVYGETSFELVDQIIEWVKFKQDDVFIDLGSGVGQVVLQVAATTDCRFCCGIEKADYPTKCALILEQEFKKLMQYFGKPYNQFTLIKGDFLGDEHQETISGSSVIFANNFAFGPVVDHQLKNRFTSLKEGAKIISSKAFCPLKFRITDRNLDDICSIMRVTTCTCLTGRVSWTSNSINYYVQQIDRSLLEDYFAKYKQSRSQETDAVGGDPCHRIHRQRVSCGVDGEDSSDTVGVNDDEERLSLSRDRSLRDRGRSQLLTTPAGDGKNESPGRRASERLLRNSKKRPIYNVCSAEDSWKKEGAAKRPSLVAYRTREKERAGVRKLVRTSRERGTRKVSDENKEPLDANRSNIDLLYRSTMDTISGKMASVNGGPDLTRFATQFEAREFTDPRKALQYAESTQGDLNTGHSELVVPVAVHEYLELVKHYMMAHIGSLQSPEYRSTILSEISNQLALRDQLNARVTEIESQIPRLHREGVTLLTTHLRKLGIQADSPSTFFSEARKLIRDQATAEADNSHLKKEIGDLLSLQRDLKDRVRQQETARDQRRHQDALMALRNNQVLEHLLQQQQHLFFSQNVLAGAEEVAAREYTSLYSPISKASSPENNHNPSPSS